MLAGNTAYTLPLAFDSISTTAVTSGGAASVTFSSIPSTYTHLQIRLLARTNRTGYSNDLLKVTFNSDTATNYSAFRMYGDGGGAGTSANNTQAYMEDWIVSSDAAGSNVFGTVVIDVLDYKDTNKHKTLRSLGGFDNNGDGYVALSSGNWRSTSAITSVSIAMASGTSFKQYSHFALYGIKAA